MLATIFVPIPIQRDLIAHAERESPREAIGMLGGRGAMVMRALPLRNRAARTHAFFADPYEQYLAERSLAGDGLEIVALYHSHPGGGAFPSEADRHFAAGWPCVQLILAPRETAVPEVRAYRWADGNMHEIPVQQPDRATELIDRRDGGS